MIDEEKYVLQLVGLIENFRRKDAKTFWGRCPVCGDSKKSKSKFRFYIYKKNGSFKVHCFNCAYHESFRFFVKAYFPDIDREMMYERFRDNSVSVSSYNSNTSPKREKKEPTDPFGIEKLLEAVSPVPGREKCISYLNKRKIPQDQWERLAYCSNFSEIAIKLPKYKDRTLPTSGRLIFPFYNKAKELTFISARSLDDRDKARYLTLEIKENFNNIFGLERHDPNKKTYVVEGPADSLFLPNSLAAATSDLVRVSEYVNKDRTILIFDYQPRNNEIVNLMRKASRQGFTVCVWPPNFFQGKDKDINDMILSGKTVDEILNIVDNNSYKGLKLELEISKFSKIKG